MGKKKQNQSEAIASNKRQRRARRKRTKRKNLMDHAFETGRAIGTEIANSLLDNDQ